MQAEQVVEDQDFCNPEFIELDKLAECGINVADINKLKSSGITSVKSVIMFPSILRSRTHSKALLKIKGLSEAKVDKIKDAASRLLKSDFITGLEVSEKRKHVVKISTGSKELDKLIGGGVQSSSITEAFGEFRTGFVFSNVRKTQICHTLCVMAQLPVAVGGASGKVAFIDTGLQLAYIQKVLSAQSE